MTLRKLYGLKKYLLELSKLFDIDRFPQVVLLSGKKGQGKIHFDHIILCHIFLIKKIMTLKH